MLDPGRTHLLAMVTAWAFIAWVVLPSGLLQQFLGERRDGGWILIELTAMPPLRILTGYVWASGAQQLLCASAMAPFLALSWILYGVDPLLVVLALLTVPLVGLSSLITGLQTCTQPRQRISKRIPGQRLSGILQWLFLIPTLWWVLFARLDVWMLGLIISGDLRAWLVLGFAGNAWAMGLATTLVHSGANLLHPAMDSTSPRRLMVVVFVLNAVPWLVAAAVMGPSPAWAFAWWSVMMMGRAMLALLGACMPLVHTPRQAATWNQVQGWRRWLRGVLTPDGGAGRRFFLVLCGMAVGGALVTLTLMPTMPLQRQLAMGVLGAAIYGCWFLVLADRLTLALSGLVKADQLMLWVLTGLTICSGLLGPLFLMLKLNVSLFWLFDWVSAMKAATAWSVRFDHANAEPMFMAMAVIGLVSFLLLLRQSGRPVSIVRRYAKESDADLG
jgi:hypothetical protein